MDRFEIVNIQNAQILGIDFFNFCLIFLLTKSAAYVIMENSAFVRAQTPRALKIK